MSTGETTAPQNPCASSVNAWIENFTNAVHHVCVSTKNFIEEQAPKLCAELEKIQDVACKALQLLAGVLLFITQQSLFVIGFLASVINPKFMNECIERISKIWNRQTMLGKGLIIAAYTVSWPISVAASAFFFGGYLALNWQPIEWEESGPGTPISASPNVSNVDERPETPHESESC